MSEKILSISMRPQSLSALYGQDALVKSIRALVAKRAPSCWMFSGNSGCGKTTVSKILAVAYQCDHMKLWGDPCPECWRGWSGWAIHEINSSDKTGIEDARKLVDLSKYKPTVGKKRVIIVNECFPGDTLLDTPDYAKIAFRDIRVGDKIRNAFGVDVVKNVWRRKVKNGVKIEFSGKSAICSRGHLFLTPEGWIRAGDLKAGQRLVCTSAAMRIMRQDDSVEDELQRSTFLRNGLRMEVENLRATEENCCAGGAPMHMVQEGSSVILNERHEAEVLQQILRGELQFTASASAERESRMPSGLERYQGTENDSSRSRGLGTRLQKEERKNTALKSGRSKAVSILQGAASARRIASCLRAKKILQYIVRGIFPYAKAENTRGVSEENAQAEPHEKRRYACQGFSYAPSAREYLFSARRKRDANASSSENSPGSSRKELARRTLRSDGLEIAFPSSISDRHRLFEKDDSDRGRWRESQQETGSKEGSSSDFARVDRITLLEPGDPELEQYREADGFIYFYDLEATRHPSFSVEGVLVHNCHRLSGNAQDMLLDPTEKPADHVVWIFVTTEPNKIVDTLRKRCVKYQLRSLGISGAEDFLKRAAKRAAIARPLDALFEQCHLMQVSAPRDLLMALEKYAAGSSAVEAVSGADESGIDSLRICRAITSGKWSELRDNLKTATPEQSRLIRASVSGWLRGCLIRATSPKDMDRAAASMVELAHNPLDDAAMLHWLWGALYKVCVRYRA